MPGPIDPSFAVSGPEWQIGGGAPAQPAPAGASGFGALLNGLADTQNAAAAQSQALATGQASDPEAVVMAVERARLSMQLASTIRTKGVDALQDIFRTQV